MKYVRVEDVERMNLIYIYIYMYVCMYVWYINILKIMNETRVCHVRK